MDTSVTLARLLGPVLVIAAIGILLDTNGYVALAQSMINDSALIYVAAILGLIGGIALLLTHNVWAGDWRVLLTLVGWITVLDSAAWLLFPATMRELTAPLLTGSLPFIGGVITLLIGAALSYFGYATRTHSESLA